MDSFLEDQEFLLALDNLHLRNHYARITLLSFDEQPIKAIEGLISAGSVSVNTSSAVRRTLSLTMYATEQNNNLENIENDISINKKVRVEVGFDNPMPQYQSYGSPVWFPLGVYVLSSASSARGLNGWTISIQAKDKMCLLDGTAGGTFPASVTFHEAYTYDDDGETVVEISKPTIFQIIFEAVNHWGGEDSTKIIISDVPDEVKMLVRYMGDRPIYFNADYSAFSYTQSRDYLHMYSYTDDVGYEMTPFTYPGELVFKAGDTVAKLLDKIKSALGNYEYFYDVYGNFHFQEVKNYVNTNSPLTELQDENYVKSYNNKKFSYSLKDLGTIISLNRSPKYDNVKNDFYVWGQRKSTNDVEIPIRYHLAVDEKPRVELADKYMWKVYDETNEVIVRYDFNNISSGYTVSGYSTKLMAPPCPVYEWREELYRRALRAQALNSVYEEYYDSELIAEWRKLYDPGNADWEDGWNPAVFEDPRSLNYWLDFIDTPALGEYSVKRIGRRTKVVNNKDLNSIYNKEVEDVVFIENKVGDPDYEALIAKYDAMGQWYVALQKDMFDMFSISTTSGTCFDEIRTMMYQNLTYNTTVTLTCLPKYYMEPNTLLYIEDKEQGLQGNYQITQFTLPLTYNGTMSITAAEVLTRY